MEVANELTYFDFIWIALKIGVIICALILPAFLLGLTYDWFYEKIKGKK